MKIPRIMLAAPSSGSGKTLLTCALIGALKERNMDVASCKCGPDYIDPMFHRSVLQIPSENLDTFFTEEDETKRIFASFGNGHEMIVMEGVMGLFDGLGGTKEQGSSYHLAKVTQTPILLVVDVHGMGRTMIPMIQGILGYDQDHLIKGILLNRISAGFYQTLKPLLEEEISVPVFGIFENHKDLQLESRHLGLVMPDETEKIHLQLKKAAEYLEETVSVDGLIKLAKEAPEYPETVHFSREYPEEKIRIAIAQDEAFCFYYEANLRLLEAAGFELVPFSPIHDSKLPEDICGIYLGGGYPENDAKRLSENKSLLAEIKEKIEGGMPSFAECGGFLYLHDSLVVDGVSYPMAGVIHGNAENQGKLVRFGYVEIGEKQACFLPPGAKIKGHEFHYFDSSENGAGCVAKKPTLQRSWECIHVGENHWWGFPHLYFPSNPEFVAHFAEIASRYQRKHIEEATKF